MSRTTTTTTTSTTTTSSSSRPSTSNNTVWLPIQLNLPPQGQEPQLLSPILTTTHANPQTTNPHREVPRSPAIGGGDDITALIDASDNPLEFFLSDDDGQNDTGAAIDEDVSPTPDIVNDDRDEDFFLDDGIQDDSILPPTTMRTVSPSQITPTLEMEGPEHTSGVKIPRGHDRQTLTPVPAPVTRPLSPHPMATRPTTSPAPSSPFQIPQPQRASETRPLLQCPVDSDSDSDSTNSSFSLHSTHSVPASIDADDGEEYIHFVSGGMGVAAFSGSPRISGGLSTLSLSSTTTSSTSNYSNGSSTRPYPHPRHLSRRPGVTGMRAAAGMSGGITGAQPHSYPPDPSSYIPLRTQSNLSLPNRPLSSSPLARTTASTYSSPPRSFSPASAASAITSFFSPSSSPKPSPLSSSTAAASATVAPTEAGELVRTMSPTAHRRGRSLKARSRRGVVAAHTHSSGRWRWAAVREPSPDVWSIQEEAEEILSIHSSVHSTHCGHSRQGSRGSFGSMGAGTPRLGSPASFVSSGDEDMGLKRLRLEEEDDGEVFLRQDGAEQSKGGDRKVRFVLPF